MKQLLVLSGKGGTGKTTVASVFVALSHTHAFADCDVDAPNLHLSTRIPNTCTSLPFEGMPRAYIQPDQCVSCGMCTRFCRFDAISLNRTTRVYEVDRIACEGCKVCVAACPFGAIVLTPEPIGQTHVYADNSQVFSTAHLQAGSGNSGKLVSQVKRNLEHAIESLSETAQAESLFAVIDGSPGIGCPVISSLAGVDMVLIVAEPSASGVCDVTRLLKMVERFGMQVAVCVNKADINPDEVAHVRELCEQIQIPFVGEIPYDHAFAQSVSEGTWNTESIKQSSAAYKAIESIYDQVASLLADDE